MIANRINWIDWAKCVAITMVVFGHIPQPNASFLQSYICIFHIPLFFFISGYLTKVRSTIKEELQKCFRSLIIPYFLYHLFFYPYWAIRLYIDSGVDFSVFDYLIKPFVGLFFLQIETSISSPVNGAMWFIAVLFIMRIIAHICNHTEKTLFYMTIISFLSIVLYVYTVHKNILRTTAIDGLLCCIPVYLLGYTTKQYHWLDRNFLKRDVCYAFFLIWISVVASYVYRGNESFTFRMIAFYIVLLSATYGILFLCKVLNNMSTSIIKNISIGTLVIMGLHWMFIGTTNYILEHILSLNTGIQYSWPIAIFFALAIDASIYPIILFSKKYFPTLIGK